jgi:hypothetical protein
MEIIVHRNMYVTRCGFKKKNLIRAELENIQVNAVIDYLMAW